MKIEKVSIVAKHPELLVMSLRDLHGFEHEILEQVLAWLRAGKKYTEFHMVWHEDHIDLSVVDKWRQYTK